jgi:heat shock protein 5
MLTVEFSVGDSAKNVFHSNCENTVFDVKHLIGCKVDNPEVQRVIAVF